MAVSVSEYNQLKRQVADANSARDQALGKRNGLIEQLKTEFGCATLEEAEAAQVEADKLEQSTEAAYNTAREEFDREWAESIAEQAAN